LQRGDRLPLGVVSAPLSRRNLQSWSRTSIESEAEVPTLRVLPGPHLDRFTDTVLATLGAQPYRVSSQANRMGYRLDGSGLTHTRGADLISEPTTQGALQVPSAGQPVLLMADRQTIGGYPCVATVISADMPVAAQIAPGQRVSFEVCTVADAMTALIARERALLAIEVGR
jgi:antagonist of KipI